MTIIDCANCGGTHYGSIECPYIKKPCSVCGTPTMDACSDCAIDSAGVERVHVCDKSECRDEHERRHKAEKRIMITPEQKARIAQWAGLRKPCTLTPMSSVPIRECACGYKLQGPYADGIHDNPVPDLTTPENLAKVKAALVERGYGWETAKYVDYRHWAIVRNLDGKDFEAQADTEAEALLLAIDKLLGSDDAYTR